MTKRNVMFMGMIVLVLVTLAGCAALLGTPEFPATYAPDGTMVSGTVEATPGLLTPVADGAVKSNNPLMIAVGSLIVVATGIYYKYRKAKK